MHNACELKKKKIMYSTTILLTNNYSMIPIRIKYLINGIPTIDRT